MDNDRVTDLLQAYETYPMQDGDAVVLLVEQHVATEVEGLANAWDPTLRRNLAQVLCELDVREVLVGIARQHKALQADDHRLVSELQEELVGTGITVHPVVALPAAA
jgi:hypothetical protein